MSQLNLSPKASKYQSPRGSGKTTTTLKMLEEQRVMEMLRTKPVQTDSVLLPENTQEQQQMKHDKRREVVNKIKESLVVKFQSRVAILHHKKTFQTGYNDTHFCKDMTELIEDFQTRLDKLKVDGKFYTYSIVDDEPTDQHLIVRAPLAPVEETKEEEEWIHCEACLNYDPDNCFCYRLNNNN